jgi:hypothetical protein
MVKHTVNGNNQTVGWRETLGDIIFLNISLISPYFFDIAQLK